MAIDHFCSDNVDQYSVELSAQSIVGQLVFFVPIFVWPKIYYPLSYGGIVLTRLCLRLISQAKLLANASVPTGIDY